MFSRSDTIYILVWSDKVDHTNMRRNSWQLRKGKSKVQQNLTNNNDNSFTDPYDLSNLPSSATSWKFKAQLEDQSRVRFQPTTTITVNE